MAYTSELLVNYHYPLSLVNKNANLDTDLRSNDRIWYSNPRLDGDTTWEVLKITLRKPVVVTDLSFSILNRSCYYEIWAVSNNQKALLLDSDLNPIQGTIQGAPISTTPSNQKVKWEYVEKQVDPVLISQLEIKIRRVSAMGGGNLTSMGIRDLLMKRVIRTQQDTLYNLDNETDFLGNAVRKEVRDWRPTLATDDDAYTFWKSGPQPSSDAVVNFYTTLGNGIKPERVDKIWIDPVYTGQSMNLYYSTDPTIGTLNPQPIKAKTTLTNTTIVPGLGVDLSSNTKSYSVDTVKILSQSGIADAVIGASGWIGAEFQFNQISSAAIGLFKNTAAANFSLRYDNANKKFIFRTRHTGTTGSELSSVTGLNFNTNDIVQFVCYVEKNLTTNQARLRLLVSRSGIILSDTFTAFANDTQTFDTIFKSGSTLAFDSGTGYLRQLIIKVGTDSDASFKSFLADPASFTKPRQIEGPTKNFQRNSTLDNAVLVGNYTSGNDAYGGIGEEFYTEKLWTPIWKDWKVQRGFYYLPAPIATNHLKLEFTDLTEQPYPIYETGIVVPYKVFPVSVVQASRSQGIETSSISFSQNANIQSSATSRSLDPRTPAAFEARKFRARTNVNFGSRDIRNLRNDFDASNLVSERAALTSLKTTGDTDPRDLSSALVKTYASLSSNVNNNLANAGNSGFIAETQAISSTTRIEANSTLSTGQRIPGWWILPGGLKMPESVMTQITNLSTLTERPNSSSETSTLRNRFINTSVHRYEMKYATRDAGLAYFAGIRGFQAFSVDYTVPVDSDEYKIIAFEGNVESSANLTLGVAGSNNGSYPTTKSTLVSTDTLVSVDTLPSGTLEGGQAASVVFKTLNSIGSFIKTKISTVTVDCTLIPRDLSSSLWVWTTMVPSGTITTLPGTTP